MIDYKYKEVIIPYNTGSNSATMLSYDVSGNYFDLDMAMLEADSTYAIRFLFRVNDNSSKLNNIKIVEQKPRS